MQDLFEISIDFGQKFGIETMKPALICIFTKSTCTADPPPDFDHIKQDETFNCKNSYQSKQCKTPKASIFQKSPSNSKNNPLDKHSKVSRCIIGQINAFTKLIKKAIVKQRKLILFSKRKRYIKQIIFIRSNKISCC